ncbi:MAG: vWA domain-containing protein [Gaiellaceae bacterium]
MSNAGLDGNGAPVEPTTAQLPGDPEAELVAFGRELRNEGLQVGPGRIVEFCRAASLLTPFDLYWAGRTTLVGKGDDIPTYDQVFVRFFGALPEGQDEPDPPVLEQQSEETEDAPGADDAEEVDGEPELVLASEIELMKEKSFSRCTDEELAQLAELMQRIRIAVPHRRTRRREAAKKGRPDLRRTIRRSFRTGGEPIERHWHRRRTRRRRLILILDVSGSMAAFSRALLVFGHAALRADPRWEAFCFGTRLTRLTQQLKTTDPDTALDRASADVFDWDGGTRIGESLKVFLDEYGHKGMARGAIVLICSDGLEIGAPELLGEQMARLSRLAHRVIWLNPLKEDPAYEPLARGMRAALPYIDLFASGHNLASLETLSEELAQI